MKKLITLFLLLFMRVGFGSPHGLVAHWKMNDNAGNATVVDSAVTESATHYNGTFNDAGGDPNTDAHTTAGKINPAFTFDGTDDYIDIGKPAALQNLNDFTISVWVNSTLDAGEEYILSQYSSGSPGAGEVLFLLTTSDKVTIDIDDGLISVLSSVALEENTWYHLGVVMVADTSLKLYIDGVLNVTDLSVGTTAPYFHASENILIGSTSIPDNFFTGKIDNVMIFNTALTADKIKRLYNGGHGTEIMADLDESRRIKRR